VSDGTERIEIGTDQDVVRVRQLVRTVAVAVKLSLVDQTKLVTAASELARNTLVYGGGGEMAAQEASDGRAARGLRLTFTDAGPGIADLDQALSDGFTSGEGLGMGLGGARRLVHDFAIDSAPGAGTTVTVTSWAVRPPRPREEQPR